MGGPAQRVPNFHFRVELREAMSEFVLARDRDAFFVVRGFAYQVDLTILRWLDLNRNQILELERGEDIDIVSHALSDSTREIDRQLEQVKHVAKNLTLRSKGALAALANAIEHRSENPDLSLTFRFCTNALPVTERPSPFADRMPAIAVWEKVRLKQPCGDWDERVSGIRAILQNAQKPTDVPAATWALLSQFCATASRDVFLDFIYAFEWSTGTSTSEQLKPTIVRRLLQRGDSPDMDHAKELYARLFVHVMRLLCQTGLKQLTPNELASQAGLPTLSEQDRALLNFLASTTFDLAKRVGEIEQIIGEGFLDRIATDDLVKSLSLVRAQIETRLPPMVAASTPRRQTVARARNELTQSTWRAFYGAVGSGKTHLMTLIAQSMGGSCKHVSFRDLTKRESLLTLQIVAREIVAQHTDAPRSSNPPDDGVSLGQSSLLLLDDLPSFTVGDGLFNLLVNLTRASASVGSKVISTSYHQLPSAMHECLKDEENLLLETNVPRFSDEEAAEVFAAHGALRGFYEDQERIAWLNQFASGHATLLAALARFFVERNWTIESQELEELKAHRHATDVINETVSRLLETTEESDDRSLLYRLALILGSFGLDNVLSLAGVTPEVGQPRERLNRLIGLWVEPHAGQLMTVSPLVKPLAATELAQDLQVRVHLAQAEFYLSQHRLNVILVAKAVHHLGTAGQHDRAAILLILALTHAHRLEREDVDLLLAVSWKHSTLPVGIDLGNRIYLRTHQIVTCEHFGISIQELLDDAHALVAEAERNDAWAVFAFAVLTAPIVANIDFDQAARNVKRALECRKDVINSLSEPGGREELRYEELVWLIVTGIRKPSHLSTWLELVRTLSDEETETAFASEMAELACMLAIDGVGYGEAEKPVSDQDWDRVLDAYDQAIQIGRESDIDLLRALGVRAKVTVLAGHLDKIDEARAVATEAAERYSTEPRTVFVVGSEIGRQLLAKGRVPEALDWFRRAFAAETDAFPNLRCRYLIDASRAAGDDHPQESLTYARGGVAVVRAHPRRTSEFDFVIALGELAIAEWLGRDLRAAFLCFDEAARALIDCKDSTAFWKQLFVMFGHTSGYLSSLAATGQPPQSTPTGEPYARPQRGMLANEVAERAESYQPDRDVLLYAHLSTFGEGVEDYENAASWALRGLSIAREQGILEACGQLGLAAIAPLILSGQYTESFDVAVEACAAIEASRKRTKDGFPIFESGVSAENVLGPSNSDEWQDVEHIAAKISIVAALLHALTRDLDDGRAAGKAEQIIDACEQMARISSHQGVWCEAGEFLHTVFDSTVSHSVIQKRANDAGERKETTVQMLGYLGATVKPDARLEGCALNHAIVFAHLSRMAPLLPGVVGQIYVPFIVKYWKSAFAEQRFRFRSPDSVAHDLQDAIAQPMEERVRAVLATVIRGLGIRMPERVRDAEAWLRGHQ